MTYESIWGLLEDIAGWLKDDYDIIVSPENRKRLDELSKKIKSCSSELESIVKDDYKIRTRSSV